MKDEELRQHIIDELSFEPSIDAANVGVAVENGIATLSGHVASFAEKVIAERATQRVKGVRGIAQEIEVRFSSAKKFADDQIAGRALDILAWDTTIPDGTIQVKVEKGLGHAFRKSGLALPKVKRCECGPQVVRGDGHHESDRRYAQGQCGRHQEQH